LCERACVRAPQSKMPLASGCVACLVAVRELSNDAENAGAVSLAAAALDEFMRLDSAAVSALNLLPSQRIKVVASSPKLSSVHCIASMGCWSKGGARVLQRWILQPLMDVNELSKRQDLVELFVEDPVLRSDLKGIMVRRVTPLCFCVSVCVREWASLR
jgi:DNA mismatch repair protein MSH2